MPTTQHDAAEYFADSVSRGAPAATEAAQAAYVNDVRTSYQSSKESSYSQYRDLTGVADPAIEPEQLVEPETVTLELDDPGPTVDAPIADIKEWVGSDLDRAAQALENEQAKDAPRVTLVSWLEELITSTE